MQIQVTINADPRSWRRLRRLFIVGMVVLAIAAPAAVWATHDFSDVPTSDQFHTQISAIKAAGITTGCTATTYCPTEFVRRDAMAAFLQRGLGRAGRLHFFAPAVTATEVAIGSVSLTVPSSSGVTVKGFVLVNASGSPFVTSGCTPCYVSMRVSDPVTLEASYYHQEISNGIAVSTNISATYLFPVTATGGTTRTFNVDAYLSAGTGTVGMFLDATALWVPFGSTGGSTP